MHTAALSLRQLRFLVTLADTASFSRAAERLAISQPALSSAIGQLEAQVAMRLFDRTTHRVTLTAAGASILPHARRLLITADNAFVDMGNAARHGRAVVRIGAIPSSVPALAEALATIDEAAEGISVHLSDGKSDALLGQLRTGSVDMVVCVAAGDEEGLSARLLMEDDMLLVVPNGHALADAPRRAWSALKGHEIVHFAGGSIGELSSAAMRQSDLVHSPRYLVDQVDSLLGIVHAGLAVGVMPRLYTRGFARERVTLVPLVRPAIRRRVVLLSRTRLREEHPHAHRLAEQLAPDLRRRFADA